MTTGDEESRKTALISSKVLSNAIDGCITQKQTKSLEQGKLTRGLDYLGHLGILQNVVCNLAAVA